MQEFNDNDRLYQALLKIKEHPEFWLGGKSLNALLSFIRGYEMGKAGISTEDSNIGWYDEFTKYVSDFCLANAIFEDDKSGISAIYKKTPQEEDAFDLFFHLLEQFQKRVEIESHQEALIVSQDEHDIRSFRLGMIAINELLNLALQDNGLEFLGVGGNYSDYDWLMEWEENLRHLRLVLHKRDNLEQAKKVMQNTNLFLNGSEDKTVPPCKELA